MRGRPGGAAAGIVKLPELGANIGGLDGVIGEAFEGFGVAGNGVKTVGTRGAGELVSGGGELGQAVF